MNRKRSESAQLRDEAMLAIIQPIKAGHPAWGYRRIWAYLCSAPLLVNVKLGEYFCYLVEC